MKRYLVIIIIAIVSSACQKAVSSGTNSSAPAESRSTSASNSSDRGDVKASSDAPVEFTALGVTADKANIAYRIKVNTDKPIDEVHLALKATDGKGKVSEDTIVWQNIVGSTRRPIESGKVYEDQSALDEATVKADVSLKQVIFKNGTKWSSR